MYYPSLDEARNFVEKGYSYFPLVIKKKQIHFNPINLFNKLKHDLNGTHQFIFESGKVGRYTYIGGNPFLTIEGKDNRTIITKNNQVMEEICDNPIKVLREWMGKYSAPKIDNLPDFYGGVVGYLSYDMARYFEELPQIAKDDLNVPDLQFMFIDELWIYDHSTQELYFINYLKIEEPSFLEEYLENKKKDMLILWNKYSEMPNEEHLYQITSTETKPVNRTSIKTSFTKAEFVQAVNKIKEYIANGDVFQVNLSIRQSRILQSSGIDIYKHLRIINPSPYMGYLKFQNVELVSASPELLIKVKDKTIQTRPIAGTRKRGQNDLEDEKLVTELLNNEKEIAEHIMLVDLERNDLGRVCRFGTVKVNELMVVEKYSHVIHIVSNILGEIDNNSDIYDCIRATFPGGTITGAPKIRTMEIIDELEPVRRGLYTGSMGWIGFQGDLELNILIRTLLVKEGQGHIQAGAGIVIDSIPENEYIESLTKAEALWKAVESSEKEKINGIVHR